MRIRQYILICLMLTVAVMTASAQEDKRDVRRGNRDFRKQEYKESEIEYRKGLVKDSLSVAANYNLAASLYRQGKHQEAAEVLKKEGVKGVSSVSEHAADYFYNLGDAAIAMEDWQTAVDALQESLLRNPSDMDARENYIYAKKKLEKQQQDQQNQQNNQDQNNQNSEGGQGEDNQDKQDKKDQQDKKDDKKDEPENDQNKDNQDQQQNQQQNQQQPKITPQAAQQMLQAIQAKEKETQEKVQKEKAQALQSRQKERNW